MGRVRVLWLIKGLGPGGAEQLLLQHARAGDHARFRYEAAYLLPWKDHLVPDLESAGVTAHCLEGSRLWDLRWVRRLRRLVTGRRYDIVHVHSPAVAVFARIVLRSLPTRDRPGLVYTEHNRWSQYALVTRLFNRVTYRLDDVQLAVAAGVRRTVPPRLRDRVDVLHHGIDLALIGEARAARTRMRAELDADDGTVLVGAVANLRREKDYPVLLRAAAAALAVEPRLRFVAVGQGPLEADIRSLHRELDLGDRFWLLGYRPDALEVISALDAFTLSSKHEGLPLALLEALALGVPVVATRVGGIPEVVTHGREGLLVDPGNPGALADAYLRLADDATLRGRMGEAAGRRGAELGSKPAVRRLEAIYTALAAGRRTGSAPAGWGATG